MVEEEADQGFRGAGGVHRLLDLPTGSRVKMKTGALVQVTGNPKDGCWLLVQYIENPEDASKVGDEELVYFVDVEKVV
jgi:hypothetical protein